MFSFTLLNPSKIFKIYVKIILQNNFDIYGERIEIKVMPIFLGKFVLLP